MIADTWLLITLRWNLTWNGFLRRSDTRKVLTALGWLLAGLLFAFTSVAVGWGAGALLVSLPHGGLEALLPGLMLTAIMLLLLLSSFGVALGVLFLNSDMDLLMSAPVSRRAVFISKLFDGMAPSYALLAVTAVPGLLAYGVGLGYGPLYYAATIVSVLGAPLLPAGLGAVLVMLVARFAPARRVREVLGLMGALFGIACGLLGQTSRLWMNRVLPTGSDATAVGVLDSLRGLENAPLPSMLAGKGLAAAGTGAVLPMLGYLAAFLVVTFGLFAGCVWVAEGLYASGWVRMQSSGVARRSRERNLKSARGGGLLAWAPADLAIILKDWRIIPRDMRNFAQMLSPLLFLPVIYINLIGARGGRGIPRAAEGLIVAGGILMAAVSVCSRIAGSSISMEGKNWWLLKIAPVSPGQLLRGKYLAVAAPFAILSTVLLAIAAFWRGFSPVWTLYGWVGMMETGGAMLAVGVGLSVPWAKLDWEDPRRMGSGPGTLITLGVWAGLALACGALLCLPLLAGYLDQELVLVSALVGLVVTAAVCTVVGWFCLRFGASRLNSVGEA